MAPGLRVRRAPALTGALLLVAVLWPTFTGGGFSDHSQSMLILWAALAVLVAAFLSPELTARVVRNPVVVVLVLLAGLCAVSAVWTVASAAEAVRYGLVIAAYAAVFVSAAVLATQVGPWLIAGGIGVLAAVEAVIGLIAASTHTLPDAERLVLIWRPGGTFQYQPALAVLEVGALPIFWWGIGQTRRTVSAAGASGAVLAGATIAMTADRLGVALAVLTVCVLAIPDARRHTLLNTGTLAGAGVLGATVSLLELNHSVKAGAPGRGLGPVVIIVAAALLAGLGWALASARARRTSPRAVMLCGACALTVLAGVLLWRAVSGSGSALHSHVRSAGLLHGRGQEWSAALRTWMHRPFLGSGAGSYQVASAPYQTVAVSRFAHDLPLELAAEMGIPGLLGGLGVYAATARGMVSRRKAQAIWLLGPLVVVFLISNLVDWTWHLGALSAIWAVAAGTTLGVE